MSKSLEQSLFEAVVSENLDACVQFVSQGANPNRTGDHGRTCLGEAAYIGNIDIVKLLIDASIPPPKASHSYRRKHKSHKRKIKHEKHRDETVMKHKNVNQRGEDHNTNFCEHENVASSAEDETTDNQGYYVCIHSDGSSSDESRISNIKSPLSPSSLTSSPQADLEWDEDIGKVAPMTRDDEKWMHMYQWYATILENTGSAITFASRITNGVNQHDAYMKTALHYAALKDHIPVVQLLLDAGCNIDITAGDGLTALHVAVIRNHAEIVRILIAAGSQVNCRTYEKTTPLHFAASRGYLDLVILLVNNGANLEGRDTSERTPLYLAAGRGYLDVVRYLVSCGVNVNGEEIHTYTPLCEAVWQRYAHIVEFLLSSGARITHSHKLLHYAIIHKQVHIVAMLCDHGGLNLYNDNGDTPLLLAARMSYPNIAKILLEKGANVNACNNITGATALHTAVESVASREEFQQFLITLLEYNIDLNCTALTGDTALNRACLLQKNNAAHSLIAFGADVNASDLNSCGLDNLMIASKRKTPNLASLLLKAGHVLPTPDETLKCFKPGTTLHWLYYTSMQPFSLSDLCRIKIRKLLKSKNILLHRSIDSLYLPKTLKRFLMMEEIEL